MKKTTIAGLAAAGTAGVVLCAAQAQAFDANFLAAERQHAAVAAAAPHMLPHADADTMRLDGHERYGGYGEDAGGKERERGKLTTSKKSVATKGHKSHLSKKNKCNNNKIRVNIYLKNAKYNNLKIYIPSKGGCTLKGKVYVKKFGDTKAKRVHQ